MVDLLDPSLKFRKPQTQILCKENLAHPIQNVYVLFFRSKCRNKPLHRSSTVSAIIILLDDQPSPLDVLVLMSES